MAYPNSSRSCGFANRSADSVGQSTGRWPAVSGFAVYTSETRHLTAPDLRDLEKLVKTVSMPVISEGQLPSVDDVRRAFDCGAFAVVVGGAITGIDKLFTRYAAATPLVSARSSSLPKLCRGSGGGKEKSEGHPEVVE